MKSRDNMVPPSTSEYPRLFPTLDHRSIARPRRVPDLAGHLRLLAESRMGERLSTMGENSLVLVSPALRGRL